MSVVVALFCLSVLAASAHAECAWVLWVEAPLGSDQWSVASIPQTRFLAREDCEQRADDLNAFELTLFKMQGLSGEARDVFSCFPDAVDPRPEGALQYEGVAPRGPKGK
jgi:hypothetical protein